MSSGERVYHRRDLIHPEPGYGFGARLPTCPECGRRFDMLDDDDANEWHYGHDCEA